MCPRTHSSSQKGKLPDRIAQGGAGASASAADRATSFSVVLAALPDLLFHLKVEDDDDYRFVQVNQTFYSTTGLQPEQVIGKCIQESVPASALPLVLAACRRAVRDGTVQSWEETLACPRGCRVGQATVTPVFDGAGRCTDLIGTVHDISALADREERLNLALSGSEEGVWDWQVRDNQVFFSGQWKRIVGLTDDWEGDGQAAWSDRIHPDDRAAVIRHVQECLRTPGRLYRCEYRLRHASGDWIWIRSRGGVVERSVSGEALRMIGTMADITEAVRLRQQVEAGQARLLRLSQQLPGAVFELRMDAHGALACPYASDQVRDLFDLAPEQVQDDWMRLAHRIAPADRRRVYRALRRSAAAMTPFRCEFRARLPHRGLCWREASATPVRLGGGRLAWYGFVNDITQRKHTETTIRMFNEAMERRAHYDGLTGLPNRALFRDRLEQGIRHAAAAGSLALLFIDLDRFKEINDLLGHDAGDQLLVEAARRIGRCVHAGDTVARLGGDEFTVILTEAGELGHVEQVAQRILDALALPFGLKSEQAYVGGSIGIALFPKDAADPEELMRNADHAMYRSKSGGRNRMTFFEAAMQSSAMQRLTLIADLRRALARRQLLLYYQPIVSLDSGTAVKAEALLRWNRPGAGLTLPGEFVAAAEDTGLIHELGDWVFREAAEAAARWSALLGKDFQISINRSPIQFQPGVRGLDWIAHLHALGLNAACISVEITEGVLLNLSDSVSSQLDRFNAGGIEMAIDDFGTGYSSMSYLKRLAIDYLKIDQSFIAGIEEDATSTAITETIIVMAHKLGLKVIAEGVETARQRDWLAAHGCDYAQGFLFSQPLPAAQFEACLRQDRPWGS